MNDYPIILVHGIIVKEFLGLTSNKKKWERVYEFYLGLCEELRTNLPEEDKT